MLALPPYAREAAMFRTVLVLAAALSVAMPALAGPGDIEVCNAIPVSDVEGATGLRFVSSKPGYRTCTWRTADPLVWVDAKAGQRTGQAVSGTAVLEGMKKMGANGDVTDDTADLWCARILWPPDRGSMNVVQCHALTKGHYFEAQLVGAGMTREKAKALIQKMTARLP